MYGASTATTLVPILAELHAGTHYPNEAARWTLILIYLPYLLLPLWMMFVCATNDPVWGAASVKAKRR
jgi:hypothetical protein